ncbi:MAG: methyltransferase domain-containing protein [Saprospiraceae bacterium]
MRLMQHKNEAWWFYRYLSIFYDKYVNPLFWTERMRDESLELGKFDDSGISVIDVGSGTGFTTTGIVGHVPAGQVTCVDQSPHQMAKAKDKEVLKNCTFQLGDAEDIPVESNQFDRYVSAGSIEYWPDPQRGIHEAFRVIKPGGRALMIGPLEPKNAFGRFIANTWMLFPKEEEYRRWFKDAGFENIELKYIEPEWFTRPNEYGLAIAGDKPVHVVSPPKSEVVYAILPAERDAADENALTRTLTTVGRVVVGSLAGGLFIPIALVGYVRQSLTPPRDETPVARTERLNRYQTNALIGIGAAVGIAALALVLRGRNDD